jgi:hypothetical protein
MSTSHGSAYRRPRKHVTNSNYQQLVRPAFQLLCDPESMICYHTCLCSIDGGLFCTEDIGCYFLCSCVPVDPLAHSSLSHPSPSSTRARRLRPRALSRTSSRPPPSPSSRTSPPSSSRTSPSQPSKKRLRPPGTPSFDLLCLPHGFLGDACPPYCRCTMDGKLECVLGYGCEESCTCIPKPPSPPRSPPSAKPCDPGSSSSGIGSTTPWAVCVPWSPFSIVR